MAYVIQQWVDDEWERRVQGIATRTEITKKTVEFAQEAISAAHERNVRQRETLVKQIEKNNNFFQTLFGSTSVLSLDQIKQKVQEKDDEIKKLENAKAALEREKSKLESSNNTLVALQLSAVKSRNTPTTALVTTPCSACTGAVVVTQPVQRGDDAELKRKADNLQLENSALQKQVNELMVLTFGDGADEIKELQRKLDIMVKKYGDAALQTPWDNTLKMAQEELQKTVDEIRATGSLEETTENNDRIYKLGEILNIWQERVNEHPEMKAILERERQEWYEQNKEKLKIAYDSIQEIFFPRGMAPTIQELRKLTRALEMRYRGSRVFSLLLNPEKIEVLEKLSNTDFTSRINIKDLDIVELRALYYIIPKNYDKKTKPAADAVFQLLSERLMSETKKELKLGRDLPRHRAYSETSMERPKPPLVIKMADYRKYTKMYNDNKSELEIRNAMNDDGKKPDEIISFFFRLFNYEEEEP
jgi:cell division protein FtsB